MSMIPGGGQQDLRRFVFFRTAMEVGGGGRTSLTDLTIALSSATITALVALLLLPFSRPAVAVRERSAE
jgi:hypothetical protein